MPVLWPDGSASQTPPRVSSEWGWRIHPITGKRTLHEGIDLVGWSTIKAPASGVVSFAGYNGGAGNEVRIKAANGDVFRMLHNRVLYVRTGERVTQGQDIAVMGTTGASTGVHCHFETRPGGGASENPRNYMARANAGAPAGGGSSSKPVPQPIEEEDKDIMKIIGDGKGNLKYADEFGVDDIGMFFFVPNGVNGSPSWVDNINGALLLAGEPEIGKGAWDMDLARHQGNARWDMKRGQIVTDVVNSLSPLLQQIAQAVAGIDPAAVKAAIAEGLKSVVVKAAPISAEDKAGIAETVLDLEAKRLKD